jgi:hypothetical protein
MIVLMFAFVPSYGLSTDEGRAFLVLTIIDALYVLALARAQVLFGWARLTPLAATMNVLLVTLSYAFLYRVLPTLWLLYFDLPIIAAMLFSTGWAYLTGALCALGYLTVLTIYGAIGTGSNPEILNMAALVIFSLLADGLGEEIRRHTQGLKDQLATQSAELQRTNLQVVLALANAVEARDSYTGGHAERLREMALVVGRALGMKEADLEELGYAAILHDIGKIGVSDGILKKPSSLDALEWREMRMHPKIGAGILTPIPRLAGTAQIVLYHHEWFDGTGYPFGLKGEEIPLGARILTVVDSYSAIVDKRVYRDARDPDDAIAELRRCAGTQFDPRVVNVFAKLKEKRLVGRF